MFTFTESRNVILAYSVLRLGAVSLSSWLPFPGPQPCSGGVHADPLTRVPPCFLARPLSEQPPHVEMPITPREGAPGPLPVSHGPHQAPFPAARFPPRPSAQPQVSPFNVHSLFYGENGLDLLDHCPPDGFSLSPALRHYQRAT